MEDESPFTPFCREMMSEFQQDILTELREEADTPYPDRIRLSDVISRYYDKMLYIIECLRWLSGLQNDPEMWLPKPDDNADEDADVARAEVPPFIITGGISDVPTLGQVQIEELSHRPSVMEEVLGQPLNSTTKKSLTRRESSNANEKAQSASTIRKKNQDQGDIAQQKKSVKKKVAKTEPLTTQESDSETTAEDMKRYSRISFLKTPSRFLTLRNLMPKHSKRIASSTLGEIPIESTDEERQMTDEKSSRNDEADRTNRESRSERSDRQDPAIAYLSQEGSIESKYSSDLQEKSLIHSSQKEEVTLNDDITKGRSSMHKTRRMKLQRSDESTEQEDIRRHQTKERMSTMGRRRKDSQTLPHSSPRTRPGRRYETGEHISKKILSNKTM